MPTRRYHDLFLALVAILTLGSCERESSRIGSQTNGVQKDRVATSYAIETDLPNSEQFLKSYVWHVAKGADTESLIIVRKTCIGLVDINSDEYMKCESDESSSMSLDDFTLNLSILAARSGITTAEVALFVDKLSEPTFVYKLRKYNIFGQNNALRDQFTETDIILSDSMPAAFLVEKQAKPIDCQ